MSKAFARSIKNVVNGYSTAQVKVRNATSNEPYGPSTSDMEDIADSTYDHVEFLEIMDMIDKRLNDKGKNWRHVAKALTVLDYIVRAGSENVVRWSKDNLYIIKTLREFQYTDEEGHDQGNIIRVKAKELTSLLRDDERLRQERELRSSRRNGRGRRRRPEQDEDEDEDDLSNALRESRRTAEEEERRRLAALDEDEGLAEALRLSREEEEARRAREAQNQNLLDLSDTAVQQPGVQYDIWGNPIDPYAQQQAEYQQQLYQQQLLQQQQAQAQAQAQAEQEWLQQQYLQQQYLQQQQLLAQQTAQQQYLQQQYLQQQALQQQQQEQSRTGTNNPFALNSQPTSQLPSQAQPQAQPQSPPQSAPQPKLTQTLTGSQRKNEQFSELNNLLAQGTGIDTFGNEGNTRIPAQFTKTGTFVNSSGTGYRQESGHSGNPFLNTQYTGVASTGVVPSYTGYGFGNQGQSQGSSQSRNGAEQSLIDI